MLRPKTHNTTVNRAMLSSHVVHPMRATTPKLQCGSKTIAIYCVSADCEAEAATIRDCTFAKFEDQVDNIIIIPPTEVERSWYLIQYHIAILLVTCSMDSLTSSVAADIHRSPSTIVVKMGKLDLEPKPHEDNLLYFIPFTSRSNPDITTIQLHALWARLKLTPPKFQLSPSIPLLDRFDSILFETAKQYVAGTREWVFQQQMEWSRSMTQSNNTFVLVGAAGMGKSVIQAELCRRFSSALKTKTQPTATKEKPLEVVARYFFKHDDSEFNNCTAFISSVARQLAESVPGFQQRLEDSIKTYDGYAGGSLAKLFTTFIVDPVIALMNANSPPPAKRLVVVMDALDECEDHHELITLLATFWPRVPPVFGLIVTCRPSLDISTLSRFAPYILNQHDYENRNDVYHYFTSRLGSRATKSTLDLLNTKADGLFLYAMFAWNNLQPCSSAAELEIKARQLPIYMDNIFTKLLAGLKHALESDPPLYSKVLAPILAARVPLPVTVWEKASQLNLLCISPRIKMALTRVLDFDANGCGITFIYRSMRTFLGKQAASSTASELHVNEDEGHKMISIAAKEFESVTSTESFRGVLLLDENNFLAGQGVFHHTRAKDVAAGKSWWLDISRVLRILQAQSYFDQVLDDCEEVQSAILASDPMDFDFQRIRFLWSVLNLAATALMHDPRELAGQILARSMVPPFDKEQAFWVTQAQEWVRVATTSGGLRVALPYCFGRSGLAAAATGLLKSFQDRGGTVTSVSVSADRKLIVTGCKEDHTAKVWDSKTGTLVHALEGHEGGINTVSIAAQRVFTGSDDNTAKVWDMSTAGLLHTLRGHTAKIWSVAPFADSRWVATGSGDNTVKLWDLEAENPEVSMRTLQHQAAVYSVAVSMDCKLMVTGCDDYKATVWHLQKDGDWANALVFTEHTATIYSAVLSKDSNFVVTGSADYTAKVWNPLTGKVIHNLQGHAHEIWSVAISADSQVVVSASKDKTVKVWDLVSGRLLRSLTGHGGDIYGVAISADSQIMVSGGSDLNIKVWDLKMSLVERTLESHQNTANSIAISADSRFLVTGSKDETAKVWDLRTGGLVRTLKGHTASVRPVAISHDARLVATGSWDYYTKVWDMETGESRFTLEHEDRLKSLAFSRDGTLVRTQEQGGDIAIKETVAGETADGDGADFLLASSALKMSGGRFAALNGDANCVGFTLDNEVEDLTRLGGLVFGVTNNAYLCWSWDECFLPPA